MHDIVFINREGFYGIEYQTKDFNNSMSVYIITEDGRLVENSNDTIFYGKDTNFNGTLNFYTIIHKKWHEYIAMFTNGDLISIIEI